MKLEVWAIPGCGRCEQVKARIRAANLEVAACDLKAVQRAEVRDVDVLTQSALQNGEAPVIRIVSDTPFAGRGTAFIEPADLDAWLEKNVPQS